MSRFFPLCCLAASLVSAGASDAWAAPPRVDFNRDIKPILSNRCYRCHGPDDAERKGGKDGLRLDTADGATLDQGGYAAVVPGKPDDSELIARITSTDPQEIMPPKAAGKPLTPQEVELMRQWVAQGAKYDGHWSYTKPVRPNPPAVKNEAWVRNPIDRFILSRLEREGLQPAPVADRYALIRRVSLDLTGLPPTIEEVDAFVNDADPKAYEKLVDRLLAKQAYGEHWAHQWLDLARYADSAGYADDPPRKIWMFRDYVTRAFNDNKPFDQFTIEQIAGDLLPNPTDEQLIATAFHRNTLTNNEGGTNDEEFRNVAVVDRVNTTLAVWMGTTVACAQCHNHKYDPISQEEFFRLFAIFNNTEDADRSDESPLLKKYSEEQLKKQSDLQGELAQLEQQRTTITPELQAAQAKWEQDFPLDLKWRTLQPATVKSTAGVATQIASDGAVQVAAGAATDTYTVELTAAENGKVQALRLAALTDDALPGKGPGHAGGNFVVSRVLATVTPTQGTALNGRFVRVELPGKGKWLSLAEVQVFHGADNIAPSGEAKQISTDFGGDAKRAIDGNTSGEYYAANSTTHTATADDPWWEVDLKSAQPLDRIVVWNRTDGGTSERLVNFRVVVLNDQHEPVWQTDIAAPPKPSAELALSGVRSIEFAAAFADYTQQGFAPDQVIKNPDPKTKGWAIGGQLGKPHVLTLIAKAPVEVPAGSKLTVTIEQNSGFANHTLGRFRLSTTDEPRTSDWAKTPALVIDALTVAAANRTPQQLDTIRQHFLAIAPELEPVRQKIATTQKELAGIQPDTVPVMKEMANRRVTKIQHRGNFLDLGAEVKEGVPACFPPLTEGASANRLGLAHWLVDDRNPLTARVVANRYWEELFGIGIVSTSEEFGNQGEAPFHPELLDWLATELVREKWDLKAFLKTLVTSATYQQSSRVTPDLMQRDPENRLLAHGPRFRLSAETLRDQALFVSGLLSTRMYGPPVKPPQPSIGLNAAFGGNIDWQTSAGEDKYRRGLYTTWRRSNPYPSMAAFDAPNREVCTIRRVRTNTPLQALVTLNDPVYIEAAQALARRIVQHGGSTPADRAAYGFRLCLARPPHPAEVERLVRLYEQSHEKFAAQPSAAETMATNPLGAAPAGMDVVDLAAWTVVGNVLLNLDETLMKR
jgi:hypothetical protein